MSLEEVYAEVRACVAALRVGGFPECADALDRCLYGSTSGEVLSDLGFHLKSMLRRKPRLPDDVRERLAAQRRGVDAVLRSAGRL